MIMNVLFNTIFQKLSSGKLLGLGSALMRGTCAVRGAGAAFLAVAAIAVAAPTALADLPSGYQQIEYIESSGTQRIKTGVVPESSDTIEMRLRVLKTGVQQCMWCASSPMAQ